MEVYFVSILRTLKQSTFANEKKSFWKTDEQEGTYFRIPMCELISYLNKNIILRHEFWKLLFLNWFFWNVQACFRDCSVKIHIKDIMYYKLPSFILRNDSRFEFCGNVFENFASVVGEVKIADFGGTDGDDRESFLVLLDRRAADLQRHFNQL